MTSEIDWAAERQLKELYGFLAAEMKSGTEKSVITEKLQKKGMDRAAAEQLVDKLYRDIATRVRGETFQPSSLLPALAGGALAGAVGGAAWAALAIIADYEIGALAWAIGGLCGLAVVKFSGGQKGVPLQLIAVATSLLGIAVGKYFAFAHFVKLAVSDEQGAEIGASLSYFDSAMVQLFVANASAIVSPYDLLWVGLATITAWGIARSSGISVPQGAAGPIG